MYGLDTEAKFKVGQRVRVVKDGEGVEGSNHGAGVGDVVEALTVSDTGLCGRCETGAVWWFNNDELAPAFLPGDRVRVTKHSGYFAAGDIGEVERQDENGTVYLKHGSYQRLGLPIDADSLELVAAQGASNGGQPKFKAGDRVRAVNSCGSGGFIAGRTYEVSSVYGEGIYQRIQVALDSCGSTQNGWGSNNFELIAESSPPWSSATDTSDYVTGISFAQPSPCIVARVVSGTPRPSNIPYVHGSVQAATAEAERLARNNPGKEFAVYQRVAGRVAEVSYSMKEVA